MKDHPEEFLLQRKWDTLIEDFAECFTEEERGTLKAARNEVMRDLFNEAVLKRLAGEESPPSPSTMIYNAQDRYSQGWTDPRAMLGQAIARQEGQPINNHMFAAKQAAQRNAALQQQHAYNDIGFKPFV